jgi:ATP-dependent Lhr-like helicase
MMDPRRKSAAIDQTASTSLRKRAAARTTAGRWSLFGEQSKSVITETARIAETSRLAIDSARRTDTALEAHARILLCRYGVLFRDLLARESNAPKWRDLLPILRRLEARGEIRGGRFLSGPFGEQYALPEAVESLRAARRQAVTRANEDPIIVAAADPLNLAGIVVPGERIPAVPGRKVRFRNGAVVEEVVEQGTVPARTPREHRIADMLRAEAIPPRLVSQPVSLGLFS